MSRRLFAAAVALLVAGVGLRAGADDVTVMPIMRDGQVLVTVDLSDGFTSDVRDAIQSGLPTTFSYEVELRRSSAVWFDRTVAAVTLTATVRFDNLTRRYQMTRAVDGRVDRAGPTDDPDTVQRWMTHFERIPVSKTANLEANGEYYVSVRAHTRPRNTWFVWPWDRNAARGHAKFTFIE